MYFHNIYNLNVIKNQKDADSPHLKPSALAHVHRVNRNILNMRIQFRPILII